MASFRTLIFWCHLAAGVLAGTFVLIMSATGVALTFEKQMLEWADRRAWSASPPAGVERLPPETLLARVREAKPGAAPTTLTVRADRSAPATVGIEGAGSLLVDPYSGAVLGGPPAGLRRFFRTMTSWHRWLALEGDSRSLGKSITGAANLAFLFIVLSGVYLWFPRVWSRIQFRNVLWFRGGLSAKARDFNWHNVIGIWSAIPLAVVVAGAVPISYPWAGALVYRIVGEEPPAPQGRPSRPGRPEEPARLAATGGAPRVPSQESEPAHLGGLDAGFAAATAKVPGWRSITVRFPEGPRASFTFVIDEGYGGQPQRRGTLTVSRGSGDVLRWETFGDQTAGRRLRSWLRFAHTGEYYGLAGQAVAGLVSAGGLVLVWSGLALAWRRFVAWMAQRRTPSDLRRAA